MIEAEFINEVSNPRDGHAWQTDSRTGTWVLKLPPDTEVLCAACQNPARAIYFPLGDTSNYVRHWSRVVPGVCRVSTGRKIPS